MKKLLQNDLKKLIYDRRIWSLLLSAVFLPILILLASYGNQGASSGASGDYRVLRERIERELELQEKEEVREEYRLQYNLVLKMEYCARSGKTGEELSLQNQMERGQLEGKSQVYYEDVFHKYLGLGTDTGVENRIAYREYLMRNHFGLVNKTGSGYSIFRFIYVYLPAVVPLAILAVCMAITMLFFREAGTAKLLLICPYKRWKVFASKYLVSAAAANALVFLFVLTLALPLAFQNSENFMDYPIQVNFPTAGSFLIGTGAFVTAGALFKLFILSLPVVILCYLSLFTLFSIVLPSSACAVFLLVLPAFFFVFSANASFSFLSLIPLYYTNIVLILTGTSELHSLFPAFAGMLAGAAAMCIWGLHSFQKKDFF